MKLIPLLLLTLLLVGGSVLAAEVAVNASVTFEGDEKGADNETPEDNETSVEAEFNQRLCYNGVQDPGENGVDCGGNCPWDCTEDTIEDVPVDDEETESFSYGIGAQVRMNQLLYRVIEHTYMMDVILQYVEDGRSYENGKIALEYMSELAVAIDNYDVQAGTRAEAVEAFVSFKSDATYYTAKFRTAVRDQITAEERVRIQEAMQEIRDQDLADIRADIRVDIKEHNKLRVATALENMGVQDEAVLEAILNGDITLGEVRARMAQRYQELPEEARIEARARLAQRHAETAALKARARNEIRADVQQELMDKRLAQRQNEIELRAEVAKEDYKSADAVARVHQVNDRFRTKAQVRADADIKTRIIR